MSDGVPVQAVRERDLADTRTMVAPFIALTGVSASLTVARATEGSITASVFGFAAIVSVIGWTGNARLLQSISRELDRLDAL